MIVKRITVGKTEDCDIITNSNDFYIKLSDDTGDFIVDLAERFGNGVYLFENKTDNYVYFSNMNCRQFEVPSNETLFVQLQFDISWWRRMDITVLSTGAHYRYRYDPVGDGNYKKVDGDFSLNECQTAPNLNGYSSYPPTAGDVISALNKKVDKSGYDANMYLGTDADGNVVTKEVPGDSTLNIAQIASQLAVLKEVSETGQETYTIIVKPV